MWLVATELDTKDFDQEGSTALNLTMAPYEEQEQFLVSDKNICPTDK